MSRYDKLNKILALVTVCLAVCCVIGLIILGNMPSDQGGGNDGPSVPSGNDKPSVTIDNVILPQSADAGDGYINSIYFVGDSTTYHFHKGGVDKSHLLVPDSLTLMLDSDILTLSVTADGLNIPNALKSANAEIVIITVGVNGADNFSEIAYKTYYKKLINAIKETSPQTKIIIQSVFPVEYAFSEQQNGISNQGIDRLNAWAKEIAVDCSVRYLDTQSVLKNENGAMIPSHSEGDGVHMNAEAYEKIIEYIKTHAID